MINIQVTNEHISFKIEGNLLELLSDTRHISNGLAQTLLDCASNEAKFPLLCCIQSIFSDAISYALHHIFDSADDTPEAKEQFDSAVSSVRVDMKALRDYIEHRNEYIDTEESEDEDN